MIKSEKRSILKSTQNKFIKFDTKTYTMIAALFSIWLIFAVFTGGSFFTFRNISNLFRQMSITGILAIGMVFVIISGEIDLSVGSLMGLLGGIAAILNVWFGVNGILAIAITLVLGLVFGLWNGWWIAYKKVPSFIVTLAGMLVFRGILIGVSKGSTVAPLTEDFKIIGEAYLPDSAGYVIAVLVMIAVSYIIINGRRSKEKYGLEVPSMAADIVKIIGIIILIGVFIIVMNLYQGLPVPVLIMFILMGIFAFVASKTVYGRRIYAIGGNIDAARLSGINVNKTKLIIYAINGLMAAIAGVLLTARLNAGSVAAGTNAELDAIASCVIGGASLMGGVGSVGGALIGALIMASIDNGMSMLNTQPFWQYIVKGLILLLAVWVDIASKDKN
ncbi:MAG: D-xylose transport system permease protein [Clostridiales bacterium]|jgi:D-xylose transport system permease protein|nr:D-xylose transport system permease protein [Clostridiales bacterium]